MLKVHESVCGQLLWHWFDEILLWLAACYYSGHPHYPETERLMWMGYGGSMKQPYLGL